ncbi:YcxB family protein [Aporhodopirellula aestuarii]|uniref:YcxB family protein n=1 Tax=Aporhodopirellula aestuarii TaxID=2950107 RepID=A0ABT0TZZ9_9BACT|nr:YcxB family protein [Aporhodopirellula aestuarii]MCM2370186.1 YcxB family protein [Aporhodopirellula aestuarii]
MNAAVETTGEPVVSRFVFTPQHLVDTLARFRSQNVLHRRMRRLRTPMVILFLVVAASELYQANYISACMFLVAAVVLASIRSLDERLTKYRFRKTPICDTEQSVELSDEGLRAISEIEEALVKWSAFTRAVFFRDGVLLYRGPQIIHWIPDTTLKRSDDADRIRGLLASKLPTSKAV